MYIYNVCMQKHIPAQKVRMVRKQVYITAEQDRRLKALGRLRGVPVAGIIRQVLQKEIDASATEDDLEAWKARLRSIKPIWKDRDNIQEEMQDLRKGWGRRLKRLGLDPDVKD